MNHPHAVELFVYLGIAVALVTFAVLFVAAIDLAYAPYGLL